MQSNESAKKTFNNNNRTRMKYKLEAKLKDTIIYWRLIKEIINKRINMTETKWIQIRMQIWSWSKIKYEQNLSMNLLTNQEKKM